MSNYKPLVSIVTPSYNSMPYIEETIRSVQQQDYPNIEHIVMDGGSTDGTIEFLESQDHLIWKSEPDRGQSHALNKGFQESQDHLIWKSEPDRGQSHALNKGFQLAKGEIIGWLNSDDTYEPSAIATAVSFLEKHPDSDLVYSDLYIIDQHGKVVGKTRSDYFELEKLLNDNFIKQPTVFMRREVIDKTNGVDESLQYVMDREFWLRVGLAGFGMQYISDHELAKFRYTPGTKSFNLSAEFHKEWYNVLEKVFLNPKLNILSTSEKSRLLKSTKSAYHFGLMREAIVQKERKIFFTEFFKSISLNPSLLFNRGTWMFFYSGITGKSINQLRKFEKLF
ncbi:MAG: glycosyltransferase family 2 protein [Candidatus Helarchaeota archaeon]